MKLPPQLENEVARLAALRATALLDTEAEVEFDEIVGLAAQICGAPIALISLVDENRQWYKARIGVGMAETPREMAFCAHAIADREPFIVSDALLDSRFFDNPFVTGDPHIRAYAGVPLIDDRGNALGTLCVLDRTPREMTSDQLHALGALARQAMRLIHARHLAAEARETNARLFATLEGLAASERRFRMLAEQSSELIVRYSPDGIRNYVSPASRELLGYEPEELVGRRGSEIVHPDDVPMLVAAHMGVLSGEAPRTIIYRSQRKDGEYRWFESSARAIRDTQTGELLEVQGATRDVTARRMVEERLAESEELFRTAFEAGPGGLVFLSLDGRYERVNRAFCQLVGYSEQELLNLATHDISLPEDRAATEERFVLARALGDRALTFQRRFQRKDGSVVWVQVSTRILRDAKGGPLRFVAQYQDISDLKAVDRMKDEFVSTVSHELRTPLTSIRGALGLLESGAVGELSADAREITTIARNNCDRLVRLINDILDLEKMDAGKLELHPRTIRASVLVRLALDALGTTGMSPPPTFYGEVDAELSVDVDRIVQVLLNLLSNATKFSPVGADVSVIVSRAKKGWIRFAVHDRGPGIAPDQMRKLFTRFQQLDGSDARSKSGSGLGLAISKGIVEQHGGKIGVESSIGSVFWFELPAVEEVDSGVADALAVLSAEYAAVLPERLDELIRAVVALRRDGDDASLEAATRSAHRMHGSAGSYGFADVGSAAGRIERALPHTRADDPDRRDAAWSTVDDALRALETMRPPR